MEATLIFPHQLFDQHPALNKNRKVFFCEEWLYFHQYTFHQLKLVLHRASMKAFAARLINEGYIVKYIEATDEKCAISQLIAYLKSIDIATIHYCEVVDDWLQQRISNSCASHNIKPIVYRTPNFLNSMAEITEYFAKKKHYFQTDFYTWQRKKRNILLEADHSPVGGKWTFDTDNRQKFPKNIPAPLFTIPEANEYVTEAIAYVSKNFGNNFGNANQPLWSAVTHQDAADWLQQFLKHRFQHFGIYEDAMVEKEAVLHHSVLTPMLNIGLLSPQQIIDAVLEAAIQYNVPLNSLEGFIRQVMGWREFIRIVYEREGGKQRTTNYWGFKRKIPSSFWTGETGIKPVDVVIKRVLKTGYCHHIERLMVLGNFMLLCEFDPDEVYRWFSELFIDAYDWVMVPNIYGMTQFADGGLMTTKPYISGSNYILKMSDFEKGSWQEIWDGLFWRFMHVHRDFFQQNPRLGMLLKTFDKMDAAKQSNHLNKAAQFLQRLDDQIK